MISETKRQCNRQCYSLGACGPSEDEEKEEGQEEEDAAAPIAPPEAILAAQTGKDSDPEEGDEEAEPSQKDADARFMTGALTY